MISIFDLATFHAKVYSKNSYFSVLLLTSTISIILIQHSLAYINKESITSEFWVIAGIFGFWNLCVTSAGALSFQRHQQTLMYLINNKVSDIVSIVSLLIAPATFGLLAFPLSYFFTSLILLEAQELKIYYVVAIALIYIAGIICSLLIASLFLLTKNAIIYERILIIPILFISGLMTTPDMGGGILGALKIFIPLSYPISYLKTGNSEYISMSFISFAISILIVVLLFKNIVDYSKKSALLEVV